MVIIVYANLLVNFGFGTVLVQQQNITQDQLSTVFWINFVVSILLSGIFIVCAPWIALFYEEPIVQTLTYVLVPVLILNALGICHKVILERAIDLKPLATAEISSIVVSTTVAIYMAYSGYGVWSLVAQALIKATLYNAILILSTRWWPALKMELNEIRDFSKFTSIVLANNLAEGAAGNIDRVIVGKASGSSELGAYEKAKQLMLLPTQLVSGILTRILLPTLSKLQNSPESFSKAFLKVFGVVCFVSFPMVFGLNFISEDLIPYIFGVQWSDMVPLFKIISWAGLFTILNILSDNVVVSSGNSKGLLTLTLIEKPAIIMILLIGIFWGAKGVALAYVIGAGLIFIYKCIIATQPLPIRPADVLMKMIAPLFCSASMFTVLFFIMNWTGSAMSVGVRLLVAITIGTVSYLILSLVLQRESTLYIRKILLQIGK